MRRALEKYIKADLPEKIVMLTGPRQAGKTTLSKMLSTRFDYFNFDHPRHRLDLQERSWDRSKELIIFDELHKMKRWKSWLKGVFDTEKKPPAILVTGSAKLDTYKKMGDSMAGRFFQYRLHPLDLKEIDIFLKPEDLDAALTTLMGIGGFPEPYLKGSQRFYKRWKRSHLDIILRQDLLDLENVRQISSVETLIQLLRKRVGSPISYKSLAEDLQCSDKTVKRWLTMLENMYVIFRITPYHKNIARSLIKAPKIYFYDTGQVIGNDGIKLENVTACALHKEIHYIEDCYGDEAALHYARTKDGKEIDFLVVKNDTPYMLLEVKLSGGHLSANFDYFGRYFSGIKKVQLVKNLEREKTFPNGVEIRSVASWLSKISLGNSNS
jgi:predicted AAA+ superfamily ATPase